MPRRVLLVLFFALLLAGCGAAATDTITAGWPGSTWDHPGDDSLADDPDEYYYATEPAAPADTW